MRVGSLSYFSSTSSAASQSAKPAKPAKPTGKQEQKEPVVQQVLPSSPTLSWNDYFKFKRDRVVMQRAVGIPLALSGFAGTMLVASTVAIDPTPIYGMDPMFLLAVGSFGLSALGYFSGTVGTGVVWRIVNKEKIKVVDKMDKEFFERVSRLR